MKASGLPFLCCFCRARLEKAGAALAAMFDSRADEIRSTLEEARTLRDQAQSELKKYQKLNREAAAEAEQITANATAAAKTIRENAEKAAEASIKRKEDQAAAKIKAMEAEVSVSCVSVLPNWLLSRSFADHGQSG